MRASNIELIEAYRISNNKCIQIVRIGEKYIAIAVSKDTVSMLCELTEDEIVRNSQEWNASPINFKELFDKIKNKTNTKKQAGKDE
jgi:flagellar protein FliO/FliZ